MAILIGPSSSGKSTWAEENFAPTEVVSSDELRARVGIDESDQKAGTVAFELLEAIVAERIGRRLTTVIDTTGLDEDRRARWIEAARSIAIPCYAVVFETGLDVCLARNDTRANKRPRAVIKRQHRRLAEIREGLDTEGFTGVITPVRIRLAAPSVAGPEMATRSGAVGGDRHGQHSFGLILSRFAWPGDFEATLIDIAKRAESAGFRDLWLMDHFRQIKSVGREWEDIPEAHTALSFIAARTERIRLGTLVSSVTHRHPAVLGRSLATLDVLSGGRVNCGLGLGWDREEHRNYGMSFPDLATRCELLEDTVAILRGLWDKGAGAYNGSQVSAGALAGYPRPVQDRIPILIGGSGERTTLRLVARLADAANVFGAPERVAHKAEILRRHCADVERDPDLIELTHLVNAFTASDSQTLRSHVMAVKPASSTFEEYMARNNGALPEDLTNLFARYHAAGASHSIVSLPNAHLEGSIEAFGQVIAGMD